MKKKNEPQDSFNQAHFTTHPVVWFIMLTKKIGQKCLLLVSKYAWNSVQYLILLLYGPDNTH